jgi:DNA-directed RNA polymerase subunit RPC12/RpoP
MGLVEIGLGVVASLLAAEAWDWLPWLTRLVIRTAAQRLPENVRSRYQEEWLAEAEHIPGKLFQLFWALGLIRASYRMASKPGSLKEQCPSALKSVGSDLRAVWNIGKRSDSNNSEVRCNNCGAALEELTSILPSERLPCPHCGSASRSISVSITDRVVAGASFEGRTTRCQ